MVYVVASVPYNTSNTVYLNYRILKKYKSNSFVEIQNDKNCKTHFLFHFKNIF